MDNKEDELNKLICDLLMEKKHLQSENKSLREELKTALEEIERLKQYQPYSERK